MAMFLDIPYSAVALAAVIPSILYFLGLFIQIDAYAARNDIKGLPAIELPSIKQTLKEGWYFIFVFGLLGLLVGILSDLMYVFVDPRIDFEKREG